MSDNGASRNPPAETDAPLSRNDGGQVRRRLFLLAFVLTVAGVSAWTWLRASGKTFVRRSETSQETASAAPANAAQNQIHDIKADGDALWVATSGGVLLYNRRSGEILRQYRSSNGLPHDFVEHVHVGRDGRKWFGTYSPKIALLDGDDWSWLLPMREDGPLNEEGVRFVLEDRRGMHWIASAKQGVFTYDGATWRNHRTTDGLPGDSIRTISEDLDGSIWVCTNGGVAQLARGRWTSYTSDDGLSHNDVWACVVDQDGVKWFGTWGGGISRLDRDRWTSVKDADGLASNWVFEGKMDDRGRLWFGTYNGVSVWDGTSWRRYGPEHGLLGSDVYAVEIDADDFKWFGTYRGLSRLAPDDETFVTFIQP
ncbi:MAG: hypothetical protein JXO72_16375 [Vicinamibacteria bacterium]|nr:hypothetical protein [Vicinamibacteria bacterium]